MSDGQSDVQDKVLYEERSDSIWITLNRGETMNLIDDDVFDAITRAFVRARLDDQRSVVVFTAKGKYFSAGGDLNSDVSTLARDGLTERLATEMYGHVWHDYPGFYAVESCPKTVICAMNGPAFGAGAVFVLLCDLVIATEEAKLSIAPGKWGVADTISSARLVQRVGLVRAKDLIFTARSIKAREALEIGLVNRVCRTEDLDAATQTLIDEVRTTSPQARAFTKELMHRNLPALSRSIEAHYQSAIGADFRAGAEAFQERQPAPWTPQADRSARGHE
jgi:enoyl-CoA hydratase/carnithine racemase